MPRRPSFAASSVLGYLRRDLGFQLLTSGLLLAMSPVIVIAADASIALVPLLFLPTLAVYMAGRQSLISEYHASHDVLTGLPNRSLLHDRIEHDLALARRDGTAVCVMILDLDDFKEVNDTLGHLHGDLLLQAIGPRLRKVLRETDTLARLGGDEFAVVLPGVSGLEDAITVSAKITEALEDRSPSPASGWTSGRASGSRASPRTERMWAFCFAMPTSRSTRPSLRRPPGRSTAPTKTSTHGSGSRWRRNCDAG